MPVRPAERRMGPAQLDEATMQGQQLRDGRPSWRSAGSRHRRSSKVDSADGVERLLGEPECRAVLGPRRAAPLRPAGVAVVDEVGKGRGLAVLLPHEEQRARRGRASSSAGGQALAIHRDERGQPLATRAVADVVVVLREDHEALGLETRSRAPRGGGGGTREYSPW